MSYLHRKQNAFKIPFNQIQDECEVGCLEHNHHQHQEKSMDFTFFVSIVESRSREKSDKKQSNLTTISLQSTQHPVIKITFKLKVSFFQQIINLGSILGLWFGFSAVTLARMGRIRDKEIGLEDLLAQKQRIKTLRAKYRIR